MEFLRAPRMVGSLIPTSSYVIERMLGRVDWAGTRLFVEYGPGLGTFTRPVLDRLRPDARFIAIDTNARFVDHLRQNIRDPRFEVVLGSAADVVGILADHAGGQRADYVLSGLPFSMLPRDVADSIVGATRDALGPEGAFLVYQYSGHYIPLLQPYFASIAKGWEWRNIPPCLVSSARK